MSPTGSIIYVLPDDIRREIEASRDPREMNMGHPTVPGLRDAYELRPGRPSPGNGQPGVPKLWPGREGTFGKPGPMGRPMQPDAFYDGLFDDDGST